MKKRTMPKAKASSDIKNLCLANSKIKLKKKNNPPTVSNPPITHHTATITNVDNRQQQTSTPTSATGANGSR
jgi:hypothetical protein